MEDIRNTFKNIVKSISDTSSGLIRSTKLNITISNEELVLKQLYEQMGRKVLEIYKFGGSLGDPFNDLVGEIQGMERKLEQLKRQADLDKGKTPCIHCKKLIDEKAEFCPSCGNIQHSAKEENTSLPTPAATTEIMPPPLPAAPIKVAEIKADTNMAKVEGKHQPEPIQKMIVCSSCEAMNELSESFCKSCGRLL